MGHDKIKNSKIASDHNARAKKRGIKRKRAEVAAQTYCIEEPCNVELNEKPDKETTEQPHGTQINIIHHNISLTIYLRFTEIKKITIIPVFMEKKNYFLLETVLNYEDKMNTKDTHIKLNH